MLVRSEWITADIIERMPSIKILARHGVGVDRVDVEKATACGILVTNTPKSNANAVAEHTVSLMLALGRDLLNLDKAVRSGRYADAKKTPSIDMRNSVVGLLGYGNIGRIVAEKVRKGFDANVIAYDPALSPGNYDGVTLVPSMADVFCQSDFVSLQMKLTDATYQIIGMEQFKLMKPTAYLINCARSKIIREQELYQALRDRVFRAAAIDVFEPEPPKPDNPLFALDNVILTPHMGGNSQDALRTVGADAAMCIDQALSGKDVPWQVNQPLCPRLKQLKTTA